MDSNLEACKLTFQIPQYKRWLAHLCRGYLLSSEQYCFCNTDPLGTYYVCAIFWSIFISSVLDWPDYFKCRSRFKPIFTYDRASCSFLIQVNCSDLSDCSLKKKEKKKCSDFSDLQQQLLGLIFPKDIARQSTVLVQPCTGWLHLHLHMADQSVPCIHAPTQSSKAWNGLYHMTLS